MILGFGFSLICPKLFSQNSSQTVYLTVLGTVQDGGAPHLGCLKSCCVRLSVKEQMERKVTALAVIQPDIDFTILFEATPDIIHQWSLLPTAPKAIFLTHAHMGHYTGLMHLGREALGAKGLPVYVLPKMKSFLINNGPWSQLIQLKNILLFDLNQGQPVSDLGAIQVTPILVPHRDEFSETAGYKIKGPHKSALFIPDIDKWTKWKWDLEQIISEVDFAFIDATFFDAAEINYRPIAEIPHPLVKETVEQLRESPPTLKNKIYFIHMNHTNPMLDPKSDASKWVLKQGFHIARKGQKFNL
ncbi:MAG: MBL fold metallo-hydrolase [Flavobacteriaceae bacterium]